MDNQYSYDAENNLDNNIDNSSGGGGAEISSPAPAKESKKPAKNRGLDSLRGIAVIIAVMAVLFPSLFKGGMLIFNMFYVVLGYITTVTAVNLMRKDRYNVPNFYIKRIKTYYLEFIILLFTFCGLAVIFSNSATRVVGKEIMKVILGMTLFFVVFPLLFYIWNKIADKSGPTASNIFLIIVAAVDAIVAAIINKSVIDIYPYIIGMIAALIYKKKLKYSGLPAEYKRNRTLVFIIAGVLVLAGELFFTGTTVLSRFGIIEATCAMGFMLWYATAPYLKIGTVIDLGFLKFLGKMWLEFIISFIAVLYIFVSKGWVEFPARFLMALIILGLTYLIYKVCHFISVAEIKENIAKSNVGGDPAKTILKLLPLLVFAILMIVGFVGLIVKANSSDSKDKVKKETTTETTEATTEPTTAVTTEAPTTEATTEAPKEVDASKVTIIGDFILEGAQVHISEVMPEAFINSYQNRQVYDGADIANELKDAGNLREVVVIELGTNGPFDEETGQAMIDAIGKERRIYWINIYASNRDYEKDVNDVIKALADKNENVNVIDWNAEVTKNPDYVHDGFYLTDEGLDAMTKLINTTAR